MNLTRQDAYIILNKLPYIGPITCQKLLQHFDGNILEIFKQTELQLQKIVTKKVAYSISHWQKNINLNAEYSYAKKTNTHIITLVDEQYPKKLKEIYDPPLCLYIRGNIDFDKLCNISVIGARKANSYAIESVKKIIQDLSSYDINIISGFAYGIDTIAHQTSVECHTHTTAILGHGLSHLYPKANLPLYKKILETNGTIISEFSFDTHPKKSNFPLRNRIISGLSQALIIGQAHLKSGSLITAKQALEQGRDIFAIPGPIGDDFAGSHMLIKNGAILIENAQDIITELPQLKKKEQNKKNKNFLTQTLSIKQTKIVMLLQEHTELNADQIHEYTQLPLAEILSSLLELELFDIITNLGTTYKIN